MRNEPTPFEAKLWQALKSSQLDGLKFSRQIAIDGMICDFVCRRRHLIVEIDGDTHDAALDRDRDWRLGRLGYRVLRFTNADVRTKLAGVLEAIVAQARDTAGGVTHPPTPSLVREGEDNFRHP